MRLSASLNSLTTRHRAPRVAAPFLEGVVQPFAGVK
jgi:hypothetical protein